MKLHIIAYDKWNTKIIIDFVIQYYQKKNELRVMN